MKSTILDTRSPDPCVFLPLRGITAQLASLYSEAFPAEAEVIARARRRIGAIARECEMSEQDMHGILLGITEAMTNSIVHAYGGDASGEIRVEVAHSDDDDLLVVVADDGPGLAPRVNSPGLGLGLPVVAAVARRFELVSPPEGGTEVRMTFPCPARSGA